MSKTVLIAEDYDDMRAMTRVMVETLGYEVIQARDGYDALEQAKEHCPDLILMDIAMPVMNGITSATIIRSLEHCQNVPIIALTAYGAEYADRAGEFGFDGIIQKPVQMDDLRDLLRWHLDVPPDESYRETMTGV